MPFQFETETVVKQDVTLRQFVVVTVYPACAGTITFQRQFGISPDYMTKVTEYVQNACVETSAPFASVNFWYVVASGEDWTITDERRMMYDRE
jgi:hypothetical protein